MLKYFSFKVKGSCYFTQKSYPAYSVLVEWLSFHKKTFSFDKNKEKFFPTIL